MPDDCPGWLEPDGERIWTQVAGEFIVAVWQYGEFGDCVPGGSNAYQLYLSINGVDASATLASDDTEWILR